MPGGSPRDDLTAVVEDYVTVIYELQRESGERAPPTEVADRLGVEPPTVSHMLGTLDGHGLVHREKGEPVALTDVGERVAHEVLRNRRVIESVLVEYFDVDPEVARREADRLEHHLGSATAATIEAKLDAARGEDADPDASRGLGAGAPRP